MTNIYLIAALGALIPELIKLAEGKYSPSLPEHLKNLNFWIALAAQIILGLITVFLLEKQITTNVAAAACGFGGATILTKILASFNPQARTRSIEEDTRSRNILWYWK